VAAPIGSDFYIGLQYLNVVSNTPLVTVNITIASLTVGVSELHSIQVKN